VAENLNQKNNKRIISSIILFVVLFITNAFCFAATKEEALTDDFFKAAMNVESVDNSKNIKGTTKPTPDPNSEINNKKTVNNEKLNKFVEDLKVNSDKCVEIIKQYSIQINDYSLKLTKGNKMLAKILLISVLSAISLVIIFFLLVFFKLLFGKKKKSKNPFEAKMSAKEQTLFEQQSVNTEEQEEDFEENEFEGVPDAEEIEEPVTPQFSEAEELKNSIISQPSPTDIKSAIKLFIKITSK